MTNRWGHEARGISVIDANAITGPYLSQQHRRDALRIIQPDDKMVELSHVVLRVVRCFQNMFRECRSGRQQKQEH